MSRTFLFLPAHERRKAVRTVASGADAVIFDLEAAVPDAQKPLARRAIAEYVSTLRHPCGPEFWGRVNAGAELRNDIETIDWQAVDGAVVAQAEDPSVLSALRAAGAKRLMLLIE